MIKEMAEGRAEISLIFEGMLPYSRVPVALPKPLPTMVQDALMGCANKLMG